MVSISVILQELFLAVERSTVLCIENIKGRNKVEEYKKTRPKNKNIKI